MGKEESTCPVAIVLLSGGLDSSTVAAYAKSEGYTLHALSFRYGQRHEAELNAARRIARHLGILRHSIVDVDLRAFGGSALTADIPVPKDRDRDLIRSDIPVTYVPARNTIFLSFALAAAEVSGARDIFIGISAVDYSGYPDCRPEYLEAFQRLADLATAASVTGQSRIMLHAPLLNRSKAETIQLGTALGLDYSHTLSCYDPDDCGRACGHCDSCHLRAEGFNSAGVKDCTLYVPSARGV